MKRFTIAALALLAATTAHATDYGNYNPQPYTNQPAAKPCDNTTAQAMWDTANALSSACPGYWTGYGAEPFQLMVARANCEKNANNLRQKARALICPKI
jgi:hypothetical protein